MYSLRQNKHPNKKRNRLKNYSEHYQFILKQSWNNKHKFDSSNLLTITHRTVHQIIIGHSKLLFDFMYLISYQKPFLFNHLSLSFFKEFTNFSFLMHIITIDLNAPNTG